MAIEAAAQQIDSNRSRAVSDEFDDIPVDWEVKPPAWNDPFENLKRALRGFCVPHNIYMQEKEGIGSHPKGDSDDEDDDSLYSDHSAALSQALSHEHSEPCGASSVADSKTQPAIASVKSSEEIESTVTATTSQSALSASDFLEPVLNLRKALLQGAGFCDPFHTIENDLNDRSILIAVSHDSEELDSMDIFDPSVNEEECESDVIFETRPGTSRSVRVYAALETFVSLLFLLAMTFYLLNEDIQLKSKEAGHPSFLLFASEKDTCIHEYSIL